MMTISAGSLGVVVICAFNSLFCDFSVYIVLHLALFDHFSYIVMEVVKNYLAYAMTYRATN